jgi:hypothetical protein
MSPTLNISIRLSIVFTIYLIEELHITFLNAKYIVTEKFRFQFTHQIENGRWLDL